VEVVKESDYSVRVYHKVGDFRRAQVYESCRISSTDRVRLRVQGAELFDDLPLVELPENVQPRQGHCHRGASVVRPLHCVGGSSRVGREARLTRIVSLSIRVRLDCEQFVSCVVLCRGVRLSVSRVCLSDGDCPSLPDLRTCQWSPILRVQD
jgi:hypothetical protein